MSVAALPDCLRELPLEDALRLYAARAEARAKGIKVPNSLEEI